MPSDDATCWFGIAAARNCAMYVRISPTVKQKMDVEAAHPTAAKTA